MEGDLGKYDVLSDRLKLSDTVIILNFDFLTCFTRAFKRFKRADMIFGGGCLLGV